MRTVRWVGGIVATLCVLIGLAAWFVPPMLDWTRYRGEIAALASNTLGRNVRIEGPIALTLLPQPVLTAAKISVDGGESLIAMRTLRLRVAFWPLLRGKVLARDLVMRDFDMRLPWPLAAPSEIVRRPEWLGASSARIEHGRIAIGDLAVTDIDANLTAGTPSGGYAASGTAQVSGRPWHILVRIGQPGGDGSVGLDVALDGQGPALGSGATLSGQIDAEGALAGRITARGPDLSALLPAPAVPFKADGRLTVAGGLAAADDLTVEIGGSPATGAVALRVSPSVRVDVALTASRLDLDAWLPTVLRNSGVPVPTGIDLSAEAGLLAGGMLRHLRAAFDIDERGVEVRDIRAMLPGEAEVRMTGRISHPAAEQPRFEGDASLAAPAMRTTLAWLEGAGLGQFSLLPQGVLRTAQLSGHVALGAGNLAVSGLSGMIDSAKLDGSLGVRVGRRMAVVAALHLDRLALDPWLPAEIPGLSALPSALKGIDADLKIDAGQAAVHGVDLVPFALDAQTDAGRITLRRLEAQAHDIRMLASGVLLEGGRIVDGRLDVQAKQAAQVADRLPDGLQRRAAVLLRAPLTLQIQASGAPNALALVIAGDVGDLRLEAQPTVDVPQRRWSGPMTLRHPGAPRLAEMLGLLGAPAWLGDGSLALVARISGDNARLSADEFDITAGAFHATGQLAVDTAGTEPHVFGRVSAETLPLPLPYARSPEPMPLSLLAGWSASVHLVAGRLLIGASSVAENVGTDATLAARVLRLDRMSGSVDGGALTGAISLDAGGAMPSASVALGLAGAAVTAPLFETPLDLRSGRLNASVTGMATGFSPAALLASLHGDAAATVVRGQIEGIDLARLGAPLADADVTAALSGGRSNFDTLDIAARLDRGSLELTSARIVAPGAVVTATGAVNLPTSSCDLRLAIRPAIPEPPEIVERLTGPLDAPVRTPELADVLRWRLSRAEAIAP